MTTARAIQTGPAAGLIAQVLLDALPPHIEGFTGLVTDEVVPEFVEVFSILGRIIGLLYIGIGLALVVLTAIPLRRGERWAELAIALLIFPLVLVSLVASPFLPHGLFGPQTYGYVLGGLTAIALALSITASREAEQAAGD
jgi:hypothetical protein